MPTFPFSQLDVFASDPLTGNPLAVVHDAAGLSAEQMQRFATWTNLSETVFLLPPTTAGADYRTRIFTPSRELPFAGHPTLGSAHAWLTTHPEHDGDTVVQECGIGLVTVRRTPTGLAFAAPPLLREGPVDDVLRAELAAALDLDPSAIRGAQWVVNGPEWVALLLADAHAVLDVRRPDRVDMVGVVGLHPAGSEYAVEVRAFFAQDGVTQEDPVTGSFNAGVARWLLGSGLLTAPYVARQGTVLGRAGRVEVDQDRDATIWVGGAVVTHVRGRVEI